MRLAAMLLFVAMSMATMLTVLSIFTSIDDVTSAVLARMGANKLTISPIYDDDGLPLIVFDESDVRSIKERVPQIKDVALFVERSALAKSNDQQSPGNIMAESILRHRWMENVDWQLEKGGLLTEQDSDARASVAVIGQTVNEILFGRDADPIGKRFSLGGLPFTVKGLLEEHPFMPGIEHERVREMDQLIAGLRIFIPYRTAIEILLPELEASGDGVSAINMDIYVTEVSNVENTSARVVKLLTETYGPNTFRATSGVKHVEWIKQQDYERITHGVVFVVVLVIVCGVVLWFSMDGLVAKRASEIGILRAFGARGRDLLEQWFAEVAILCAVGGVIGYVISRLVTTGGRSSFFNLYSTVEPWFLVLAIVGGLCMGICFVSYPLLRAAKVHPTEALRMT